VKNHKIQKTHFTAKRHTQQRCREERDVNLLWWRLAKSLGMEEYFDRDLFYNQKKKCEKMYIWIKGFEYFSLISRVK
jgi:hypothetical protein